MMESFYPNHVIGQQSLPEEDYWERRQLEFRDWTGKLCVIGQQSLPEEDYWERRQLEFRD